MYGTFLNIPQQIENSGCAINCFLNVADSWTTRKKFSSNEGEGGNAT